MAYGLGRAVEAHDMPAVRKVVRDAARDNYRFSSIVKGIVTSAAVPDAQGGRPRKPARPISRTRTFG